MLLDRGDDALYWRLAVQVREGGATAEKPVQCTPAWYRFL